METFISERPPFLFISDLIGAKVDFRDGKRARLVDLTAAVSGPYPQVRHAILRFRGGKENVSSLLWSDLEPSVRGRFHVDRDSTDFPSSLLREDEIPLAAEILDRQVVDTAGAKLERVNDIHFLTHDRELRLVHVDVGFRGFFRRLVLLRVVDLLTDFFISIRIAENLIPWKSIQPLAVDKGGGLRLAVAHQLLSEIHPAELADILEDVSHTEAAAILQAVDAEVAAETVAMLDEKDQSALLERVGEEDAADVLEELPADQTADILADLPPAQAHELMQELEPGYAAEVRALIGYDEQSAGGLMTSNFVDVSMSATAAEALALLPEAAREKRFVAYLYATDADGRLAGVVSLTSLLAAEGATEVKELARDHFVNVTVETKSDEILDDFKKFQIQAIPVVDDDGKPIGIVLFRSVLFESVSELAQ